MKKLSVNPEFDEEKFAALKLYLEEKNISLEQKIGEFLESLYQKNVPLTVRKFIELRSGTVRENVSTAQSAGNTGEESSPSSQVQNDTDSAQFP